MNADGSRGVDVRADIGAKVPALEWISLGLLAGGLVLLGGAAALLVFAVRRPTAAAHAMTRHGTLKPPRGATCRGRWPAAGRHRVVATGPSPPAGRADRPHT
jgi:hypothetical protein